MKQDIYLKATLTVIALCLVIITAKSLPMISAAKAADLTHCTGTITVNSVGASKTITGGYDVDISCQ